MWAYQDCDEPMLQCENLSCNRLKHCYINGIHFLLYCVVFMDTWTLKNFPSCYRCFVDIMCIVVHWGTFLVFLYFFSAEVFVLSVLPDQPGVVQIDE